MLRGAGGASASACAAGGACACVGVVPRAGSGACSGAGSGAGAGRGTGSVLSTMAGSGVMVDSTGGAAFLGAAFFRARFAGRALGLTTGGSGCGSGSGAGSGATAGGSASAGAPGAGGAGGGGGGGGNASPTGRAAPEGVDTVWSRGRDSGSKSRSSSGIRSSGSFRARVERSGAPVGSPSRSRHPVCLPVDTNGSPEMPEGRAPALVLGLTLYQRLRLSGAFG